MMALRLEPSAYELARLYDGPKSRSVLNHHTLIAVAAVSAVYGALGFYFATQRIVIPAPPVEDFNPIKLDYFTPPPPPVVEPEPRPVEPVSIARAPVETYYTEVEPLFTDVAETPTTYTGPIVLPDPRPSTPNVAPTEPTVAAPPRRPAIIQPDWERRPTSAEITRYYPERALRFERQGSAILNCAVTASGTLTGCSIIGETPTGQGFGRAAMEMTALFKMRPQTEDGFAVGGARVNVPVDFRLGR